MRDAERVTFGGSGLDRVAELRGDAAAVQVLVERGEAESILLWRGKPLVPRATLDRLVRLGMDHPVLARPSLPPILLGRQDERLVFATDLSTWRPEGLDPAQLGGFLDETEQTHPALGPALGFAELRRIMTRLSPGDAELAATAKALTGWHDSHRFCARCGTRSEMAMAGWQRNCPACGTPHFPRTDPVVIMLITRGNSVLLGRSPGWPEGMYSLLAGFVEPGETIEAAVRREVWEEAGLRVGAVSYLASQPWAFPASLMLGCRGEADDGEIRMDPHEIEDAIWLPREELLAAMAGLHPVVLPARQGAIAHFLLHHWLADSLD